MRRIIPFLFLVLALGSLTPAFAIQSGVAGEIPPAASSAPSGGYTLPEDLTPDHVLGVPGVTVDDLGDRLTDKGEDVIYLLKIIGRYFCIGAFLVSCACIILGILGNRRILASSILGALISGVCFAAITGGEQIVSTIASWAAS